MLNKNNKQIKAVVVGLGNIGFGFDKDLSDKFIFSHSKAYLNSQVEFLAGIDSDPKKRAEFEKKIKVKALSSLDQLQQEVDIISICTPTKAHLETAREALSLKPRMIILEKPLSFSLKEAREIVEIAEKEGVILLVNYQRRFNSFLQQIKQDIEEEKWGKLVKGFIKYKTGVYNSASHAINLLSFWLGDLEVISASNKQDLSNGDFVADFILQNNKALIYFDSFSQADFNVSEYDLFFEKARIRYLDTLMQCEIYLLGNSPYFAGYKQLLKKEAVTLESFFKYQLEVLNTALKILKGEANNISSGEDALVTMEIIEKVNKFVF